MAPVIFIGRVTKELSAGQVQVSVLDAFKGVEAASTVDLPSGNEAMCGYTFDVGETYLIFAARTPDGVLGTGLCNGNLRLSRVPDAVLADLENLRNGFGRTELYGVLYGGPAAQGGPPLAGVHVTAGRKGKSFSATTNSKGEFRIDVREAGDYTLDAALPDSLMLERTFKGGPPAATAVAHACAGIGLKAVNNARILGKLIAPAGVDVHDVPVEIRSPDGMTGNQALSDAQGRFEIAGIAPGEYVLGINTRCGPTTWYPFAKTLFPGVTDEAAARRYRIDGPIRIDNQDLPFSGRAPTSTISVLATREDGEPIEGAYVGARTECKYYDQPIGAGTLTDIHGRATVALFKGVAWNLSASLQVEGSRAACSPMVQIDPDSVPETLRLTLDTRNCAGLYNATAIRQLKRTHPGEYRLVRARVRSSDGSVPKGASITLLGENHLGLARLIVDDDGNVDLPVPVGEFVVAYAQLSPTCVSLAVAIDGRDSGLPWRQFAKGEALESPNQAAPYDRTGTVEFVFDCQRPMAGGLRLHWGYDAAAGSPAGELP